MHTEVLLHSIQFPMRVEQLTQEPRERASVLLEHETQTEALEQAEHPTIVYAHKLHIFPLI